MGNDNGIQSSFFSFEEGKAVALMVSITLLISLVSWVSYFAFIFPLVVFFMEKSSVFLRACSAQTFMLSAGNSCVALAVRILFGEAGLKGIDNGLRFIMMLPRMGCAAVQIICLIFMVLTLANGPKLRLYDIPFVTPLARSMSNYNGI